MADLTTKAKVKIFMGIDVADVSKDDLIDMLVPAISREMERYCGRIFHLTTHKGKVWSPGSNVLYLPNYPVRELRRIMRDDLLVIEIENTSADATGATVQVADAESDNLILYLNIVGGANAGNDPIDLTAMAPNTLAQVKIIVEALAKNWAVTVVGGTELYPANELLYLAGSPALTPLSTDLYIPWDVMEDLLLEEEKGRVRTKIGAFPEEKYIFAEYTAGYTTIPADLETLATKIVAQAVRQAEKDLTLKSEKLGDYAWTAGDFGALTMNTIEQFSGMLMRWKRFAIG